jgi:hypothetical protein
MHIYIILKPKAIILSVYIWPNYISMYLPITRSTIWYCLFNSEASSCWQLKYSTSSGETFPNLDRRQKVKKYTN